MKKIYLLTIIIASLMLSIACTPAANEAKKNDNGEKKETAEKTNVPTAEEVSKSALKAGDNMPSFELPNAKNETVKSADLLKESNLVVVFYRGDWCPYCNSYLKRLQASNKDFKANDAKLVAISVESPDDSLSVAEKNELDFTVLSDKNLDLARKFKIVFELPNDTNEKYKKNGIDLVKENGTAKPELPISATYIVNKEGEITYAFLDPDFTKRLESEDIIAELKKISAKS